MADTTNFKYTVDGFDKDHMVLFVTLVDDGRKVNIGVSKFPASQSELDALVKPFAATVETAVVKPAAPDTSFLDGVVGKLNMTSRHSAADSQVPANVVAPSDNDLVVGTTTAGEVKNNIKQADAAYIKQLIQEVLAEQTKA